MKPICKAISKGNEARRDLLVTTAGRMGTAVQYLEKDSWVNSLQSLAGEAFASCPLSLTTAQPAAFRRVYPNKKDSHPLAGSFERVGRDSIARRRSS